MYNKCKSILYTFDLIGATPQLLIFNNSRYKSILSSLISIFIILLSISYCIISLHEYSKYDNPNISYYKYNDETERNFELKNKLLIFQLVDSLTLKKINSSIAYFEGEYFIMYNNNYTETIPLVIENCEFGKNLDWEYNSFIDGKQTFGRSIEGFMCINYKNNKNSSLFYKPYIAYSFINLYVIKNNNSSFPPENIQSLIISENNIIDHNNKTNPISKSFIYEFTTGLSSLEYTSINYDFQYIKYETDNGLFYKKSKIFDGISFSAMTFFRNNLKVSNLKYNLNLSNNSVISTITFQINKSNFDCYKRSYQKLQSLLAEVMSVVSLLLEIGRQISFLFGTKIMDKEIIRFLINSKNNYNQPNYNLNKLLKNKDKKDIPPSKISNKNSESKKKIINSDTKMDLKIKESKDNNEIAKNEYTMYNHKKNKILKEINLYHIIKSYICFKDNKTNLINLCHNIISEDMCIEKIIERIYNIENILQYFTNKKKAKFKFITFQNKRLKDIINYINEITNETEKDFCIKKNPGKKSLS